MTQVGEAGNCVSSNRRYRKEHRYKTKETMQVLNRRQEKEAGDNVSFK
jgi:hypothetical protein